MTTYQTRTVAPLIEPTQVIPAQLAPYVPPPQPTVIPAASPAVPGVVIGPDGRAFYGHAPIIYAQTQPMGLDPQASLMVGRASMLAGTGVMAAGVGTGVAEVVGAMAGASASTLLAVAALAVVAKMKAPKRITNNIRTTEQYHQHVTNTATGWFGRATGSINSTSSHTTNATIS